MNRYDPIFPFTLRAGDRHGGVAGGFLPVWRRVRPDHMTWWSCDVIVKSPSKVEFVVHEMSRTVAGATGSVIAQVPADLIERELLLVDEVIDQRIRDAATERYWKMKDAEEVAAIRRIELEIRKEMKNV